MQQADGLGSARTMNGDVRAPKRRHKKTRCLRVVVSSTTQATRLHQCGELRWGRRPCKSHAHRRDRSSVPSDSAMADTNAAWWLVRRTKVPAQGAHRMHSCAHVNSTYARTDQRRRVNDRRRAQDCSRRFNARTNEVCLAAVDRGSMSRVMTSNESSKRPRVPRPSRARTTIV